jgi:hypothetical protein
LHVGSTSSDRPSRSVREVLHHAPNDGQWVPDLVGDRGAELADRCNALQFREPGLKPRHLLESPFRSDLLPSFGCAGFDHSSDREPCGCQCRLQHERRQDAEVAAGNHDSNTCTHGDCRDEDTEHERSDGKHPSPAADRWRHVGTQFPARRGISLQSRSHGLLLAELCPDDTELPARTQSPRRPERC